MKKLLFCSSTLVFLLCGCTTAPYSVPVSKKAIEESPGSGIPYYLPHPYLIVTRNFNSINTLTGSTNTGITVTNASQDVYSMQVVYLPDADQKYALRSPRGFGTYQLNVTLTDGWKLSSLNSTSDTKVVELVSALGTTASNLANVVASATKGVTRGSVGSETEDTGKDIKISPPEIWIYDLMGENAFTPLFKWTEAQ